MKYTKKNHKTKDGVTRTPLKSQVFLIVKCLISVISRHKRSNQTWLFNFTSMTLLLKRLERL
jgi:hypothetical protein